MSTVARRRLMKDMKRLQNDPPMGISAAPLENDIMSWLAIIFGPEDSVWVSATLQLGVTFSEDFPTKAPHVRFLCPVFHPNVYPDGEICLDILQNQWSPVYDITAILRSIQSLLCDPNPSSPASKEAAYLWENDRTEYDKRVIRCVEESWVLAESMIKTMESRDDG